MLIAGPLINAFITFTPRDIPTSPDTTPAVTVHDPNPLTADDANSGPNNAPVTPDTDTPTVDLTDDNTWDDTYTGQDSDTCTCGLDAPSGDQVTP